MQKVLPRILFLYLAFIFIFGFAGEVGAFELMDDRLRIQGFLRNETGYRLKDHVWYDNILAKPGFGGLQVENGRQDSGTLSTCRTTLQVETEFDVTRDLMLGVTVRGFYDAKWDLDGSLQTGFNSDSNDMKTYPDGEKLEYDIDLREYYFKWYVGNITAKVGRQQIVWGEADAFRISDIINPLDFSRDFTTSLYGLGWEDIRIPQRMIQIVYAVPESAHQFEVELVINPEDFRADQKVLPYAESFYVFPQNTGSSNWPPSSVLPLATSSSEDTAFTSAVKNAYDNAEHSFSGGARLRGVFSGWDLHLFYYHQRWQSAVISAPSTFTGLSLPSPPGPFPVPVDFWDNEWGLKMHFPRVDTIGGSFNYFHDPSGAVIRGECGYVIDEPFTGMHQGLHDTGIPAGPSNLLVSWDNWFMPDVIYKDTFHYMLGFDRPTWIPFLNETSTFFISGQFYHKIIMDYNDDVPSGVGGDEPYLLDTWMGKDSRADHKTMASLKINTKYYDDRIRPDILCVWDINAQSGYVLPKLIWAPTYDWHLEVGCIYFWSDNWISGPFGYVSHNDIVYGAIEYKF